MVVTPLGILIEVMPEFWNALFPIPVTLEGSVTELKLVQPPNALLPIVVTPLGIVIDVIFEFANASDPMVFTELRIVIEAEDFKFSRMPSGTTVPPKITSEMLVRLEITKMSEYSLIASS